MPSLNMTIRKQLKELYQMFDDLFLLEMWEEADQLILNWDPETCEPAVAVGVLTITNQNMIGSNIKKLSNRPIFAQKLYERLNREERARGDKVLKGLI